MTDQQRQKLAELLRKPVVELSVAEATFLALTLEEQDDDVLAELLAECGLDLELEQ